MEHSISSFNGLEAIAVVSLLAMAVGLVLVRLHQPPMVGYIIVGIIFGPTGFGLIRESEAISLLAELGVLLLLFLIGMELSIRAFVLVLKPAIVVMLGQLAFALGVTSIFGAILDWNVEQILLLGFVVAISSTAVAIKILEEIGELRSETGRITIGVLIAQDIAIVPMLVLAEAFGNDSAPGQSVLTTIAVSMGILGILIWYLSKPGKLKLPFSEQLSGKSDLIVLASLAFCLSAATVAGQVGLSPIYGAFIAGLIMAKSTLRSEVIDVTTPIQSLLVFIFFLSVGLLIDLNFIFENWRIVSSFVLVVVVLKSALNIGLIKLSGFSWEVALPAGLAMAQIGEFSFILAAVGLKNGVLDSDTYKLALSIIAMTFIVSPVWMDAVRRIQSATNHGLTSLRAVLTESYSGELEGIEKGKTAFVGVVETIKYLFNSIFSNRTKVRDEKKTEDQNETKDDLT